jgi:predicted AAA+ superfamily ATPase
MIERTISQQIRARMGKYPVITITGPRQSGKTTLIKQLFAEIPYFTLENPDTRRAFTDDPRSFFHQYGHRLVLDEVQRAPQLLSYIQGIVDEDRNALFVLSGSHNMLMMESVTQTLAGRTTIFYLHPLSYHELRDHVPKENTATEMMWRGGYPRIYDRDLEVEPFYQDYLETYVQRDVHQVKRITDLEAFTRFIALCAGYIGQTLDKSALATAAGITRNTVDSWLSVLQTSFILYTLQPYYRNFKKRLVKSPKLYFRDTGLACSLLGIRSPEELFQYYQRGAIFENFVVNETCKAFYNQGRRPPAFFWRDSSQHEIDLLLNLGTALRPIEIKAGMTYRSDYFRQLRWFAPVSEVPLREPTVIYGGEESRLSGEEQLMSWRDVHLLAQ